MGTQARRQLSRHTQKARLASLSARLCQHSRPVQPTVNEEKPRSSVMPLSLLCGCLSSAAVDRVVDRAATARRG